MGHPKTMRVGQGSRKLGRVGEEMEISMHLGHSFAQQEQALALLVLRIKILQAF